MCTIDCQLSLPVEFGFSQICSMSSASIQLELINLFFQYIFYIHTYVEIIVNLASAAKKAATNNEQRKFGPTNNKRAIAQARQQSTLHPYKVIVANSILSIIFAQNISRMIAWSMIQSID